MKPCIPDLGSRSLINYTIWSDVFSVPQCTSCELSLGCAAINEVRQVLDGIFPYTLLLRRTYKTGAWSAHGVLRYGPFYRQASSAGKAIPVLINYSNGTKRLKNHRTLKTFSNRENQSDPVSAWTPTNRMMDGRNTSQRSPGVTPSLVTLEISHACGSFLKVVSRRIIMVLEPGQLARTIKT